MLRVIRGPLEFLAGESRRCRRRAVCIFRGLLGVFLDEEVQLLFRRVQALSCGIEGPINETLALGLPRFGRRLSLLLYGLLLHLDHAWKPVHGTVAFGGRRVGHGNARPSLEAWRVQNIGLGYGECTSSHEIELKRTGEHSHADERHGGYENDDQLPG